ncbi:ATP-dependent Clp protease adapter ClpS [Frischella sp. Ac48]|nr:MULTISPECIES: ATP-dependent Clp protease adapter ClpS [Frischella]MBX4132039.1 ATP-dependent Clp protease adapter ClpS [Frischella sp. Ac48]
MSVRQSIQNLSLKSLAPPNKYCVILHNDDYTTMEFVVEVLIRYFNFEENEATQIMLAIHKKGQAICGIYTAEIAETKVYQVNHYARQHRFPLKCTMEQIPS